MSELLATGVDSVAEGPSLTIFGGFGSNTAVVISLFEVGHLPREMVVSTRNYYTSLSLKDQRKGGFCVSGKQGGGVGDQGCER